MRNNFEAAEEISLRLGDFIPITGGVDYSDRVFDYIDVNGTKYSESNFKKTSIRLNILGIYNTIIIGASFSGLMAGLESVIK